MQNAIKPSLKTRLTTACSLTSFQIWTCHFARRLFMAPFFLLFDPNLYCTVTSKPSFSLNFLTVEKEISRTHFSGFIQLSIVKGDFFFLLFSYCSYNPDLKFHEPISCLALLFEVKALYLVKIICPLNYRVTEQDLVFFMGHSVSSHCLVFMCWNAEILLWEALIVRHDITINAF